MIIALGIISIIAGFSVFGIRAGRSAMRLNNSARAFAQAAERARLDAIRRRTTTHIEFTDSNTYEVTMDFAGNNTSQTRAFTLDTGVVVTDDAGVTLTSASDLLPYADFDWRGRTYECNMLFRLKNDRSDRLVVQVAGSGDISVNSAITGLPTISYNTNISTTADVNPSAALVGSDEKLNLSPCGTSSTVPSGGGGGGGTSPGGFTCTGGSLATSTTYISDLKRNGGNTRTVTITVNAAGTVSVDPSALSVTTSGATTFSSSGGSVTYTVKSVSKTIATFPVKFFFSSCGTSTAATVNVKVTK